MNELTEILSVDCIDAQVTAANKKALFQQIAAGMARKAGHPQKEVAAALAEREKIGSTGFGGGTAIPHGKLEGLPGVIGYFARLTAPMGFEAVDGMPVDLVFALLSPADAGADHLKALASVSRLLRDRAIAEKLRGARSRDAMFALVAGMETLDA